MSFGLTPTFSYPEILTQMQGLCAGESNQTANLANISALLFHALPDLNWCGFYLWDETDRELILGPFQGRPACLRIRPERGVCGLAWSEKRVIRVDDVHQFPGHIACDAASVSEIVLPLLSDGVCVGVLDLDSPRLARFSAADEAGLGVLARGIEKLVFAPKKVVE